MAVATAEELVGRYGEPHRRYHTTTHVEAVLRDAAELARELNLTEQERAVFALAACAHDVIYNAQPGIDEEASASWAHDNLLRAGLSGDAIERVTQLVLLTLDHKVTEDDVVGAALLDADLAILGTPRDIYDGYTAAVREEFAAVPDDLWRAGRANVLGSLQARPQLYITAPGRERGEAERRTTSPVSSCSWRLESLGRRMSGRLKPTRRLVAPPVPVASRLRGTRPKTRPNREQG